MADLFPFALVGQELGDVEVMIDKQFRGVDPHLAPAAQLVAHGGGKRLRPATFLLFVKLTQSSRTPVQIKLPHIVVGAVLELCHTASLIHDDVLDHAVMRRGLPTVHARRGNREAVLFGDHILARAFQLLADLARPELIVVLSELVAEVCNGEILQWAEKGFNLSESLYFEIIQKKTASFFRVAGTLAGRLQHLDKSTTAHLENWGESFGMAYQIFDDLYDLLAPPKPTKSTGRDADTGVLTLPWLKLRNHLGLQDLKKWYMAYRAASADKPPACLKEPLFREAVTATVICAETYLKQGMTGLQAFPESQAKAALLKCSRLLGDRLNKFQAHLPEQGKA